MLDRREFVMALPAAMTLITCTEPHIVVKPYKQVESQIQTGDMIAWTGTGKGILERLFVRGIKRRTGPVTHVSTAVWIEVCGRPWLHIAEAMRNGLILDSLERRLSAGIKEGCTHCWWFPLADERRAVLDKDALLSYLIKKVNEGTYYDIRQAIRSSTLRKDNQPNDEKLFCSEAHIALLQAGKAIHNCNSSEVTPTDAVKFKLHAPIVYDIWRAPKQHPIALNKYINTVKPDGWRGYR